MSWKTCILIIKIKYHERSVEQCFFLLQVYRKLAEQPTPYTQVIYWDALCPLLLLFNIYLLLWLYHLPFFHYFYYIYMKEKCVFIFEKKKKLI